MSNSSKFKCPQCLSDVVVSTELAGTRVKCPVCQAMLTVPLSIGHEQLFDDLFDDGASGGNPDRNDPGHGKIDDAVKRQENVSSDQATVDESRAETRHPVEVQFVGGNQVEADSVTHVSDGDAVSGIEFIDDVGSTSKSESDKSNDPFAYDDSKALHIDGVTDRLLVPGSFYFKCPVCDSHMKATENQLGQKVKCTDCHSEVVVTKPKEKPKQDVWRQAATLKTGEEDDLKLSDLVQRPKIDYPISPEYGLDEVQGDLLSPMSGPEGGGGTKSQPETTGTQPPRNRPSNRNTATVRPSTAATRPSSTAAAKPVAKAQPRAKAIELKQVLGFDFFGDVDFMLRTAVSVVFLTLGYTLEESVWRTWFADNGLNGGEKFVQLFPALVGSFGCFVVFCWFISVTFGVLMRSVANGNDRVGEWVGFAPSEWLGSFLIFAVSAWVALLPGVLLGYLAMKITGWFVLVPLGATVSFYLLLPIVLTSAFVNESVYNVFSQTVWESLNRDRDAWLAAYRLFVISAAIFVLGILIVFLPGLLFSLIGAVLQVVGITVYAILIGWQARVVTRRITKQGTAI